MAVEDQPRDSKGRWTKGGGGGVLAAVVLAILLVPGQRRRRRLRRPLLRPGAGVLPRQPLRRPLPHLVRGARRPQRGGRRGRGRGRHAGRGGGPPAAAVGGPARHRQRHRALPGAGPLPPHPLHRPVLRVGPGGRDGGQHPGRTGGPDRRRGRAGPPGRGALTAE